MTRDAQRVARRAEIEQRPEFSAKRAEFEATLGDWVQAELDRSRDAREEVLADEAIAVMRAEFEATLSERVQAELGGPTCERVEEIEERLREEFYVAARERVEAEREQTRDEREEALADEIEDGMGDAFEVSVDHAVNAVLEGEEA